MFKVPSVKARMTPSIRAQGPMSARQAQARRLGSFRRLSVMGLRMRSVVEVAPGLRQRQHVTLKGIAPLEECARQPVVAVG